MTGIDPVPSGTGEPETAPVTAPATAPATAPDPGVEAPAPADAPRARRRLGGLLPVLALSLLTVLLLLTGYLAYEVRQEQRAQAAGREALPAARDAARILFSYSHERLDDDFEAGLALATGEFREEYERTTREVVRPVAEEYDAVVEAEVVDAAVVSSEPGRVVALVFLNQTTTSTRVDGPKIDQSRVRMTLVEVDGRWRVEQVSAL
jgi:Mce-associated membrane protein